MATKELSENRDWRAKQRERERERRRVRDRQRRQSMSLEEREKHLARRRRNYQLRRQRAEINTRNGLGLNIKDEHLALVPVTELNAQSNGITSLAFFQAYENQIASGTKYDGKYPKKLRLYQIRHLARLLNTSWDEPNTRGLQVGEVVSNTTITTKCESRTRIRVVHVKRLARALNSTIEKAWDGNPFSAIQGSQNIMIGPETQFIGEDSLEYEKLENTEDDDDL